MSIVSTDFVCLVIATLRVKTLRLENGGVRGAVCPVAGGANPEVGSELTRTRDAIAC